MPEPKQSRTGPTEFRRRKAPPDTVPQLPAIAEKADDLEEIRKAVDAAASIGAPLWLSYLFLLFYIAIAAASVKHADLLLENPVELPFLDIKLALIAFFVLAPILFVIVHVYVLAHFALLSEKANRFHSELKRQIESSHEIREGLRKQLPINIFVQFLAGPVETREGRFSMLLWAVAWISLVAGPVLALLLLQVQFLPYHDSRVTWVHRGALIVDLAFIWGLWMKILAGRGKSDANGKRADGRLAIFWERAWAGFLQLSREMGWPLTAALVAFSVLVATFPGEWELRPYELGRLANIATERIFGKVDPLNKDENQRVVGSWPVNTLRLNEFDLYEALKVDDRMKFNEKPHSYVLHDRRLEHADLRGAVLGKVDLRGAHLEGAWIANARLEGATFDNAHLQGASLAGAQLRDASLKWAKLLRASLDDASLMGAALFEAQLQGASLRDARFNGASLENAHLEGASLDGADLQGASLDDAHLQGASLQWSKLQGAWLSAYFEAARLDNAKLQGASLDNSWLQGASLNLAELQGASLEDAKMVATDLSGAFLWRAQKVPIPSASMTNDLAWGAETGPPPANEPWTATRYSELRSALEKKIPEGERRTEALERIGLLDCARKNLPPCDPAAKPPQPLARQLIEVDTHWEFYKRALVKTLHDLVCDRESESNAIYILRGIVGNGRLFAAGQEAPALIDEIIKGDNSKGEKCRASADLSERDKAMLLEVKKWAQ